MTTTPDSAVPVATATPPALPALPEVFAQALPQVQQDLAARAPAPAQDRQQVDALVQELNLRDSYSIIFFGSMA